MEIESNDSSLMLISSRILRFLEICPISLQNGQNFYSETSSRKLQLYNLLSSCLPILDIRTGFGIIFCIQSLIQPC